MHCSIKLIVEKLICSSSSSTYLPAAGWLFPRRVVHLISLDVAGFAEDDICIEIIFVANGRGNTAAEARHRKEGARPPQHLPTTLGLHSAE